MYRAFKSATAVSLIAGLTATAVAPLVAMSSARAAMTFTDVTPDSWANSYIQELASRDIIKGFPDGSFRPNDAVTRAQFSAMVQKAFSVAKVRNAVSFADVPTSYWGYQAIQNAYTTGFMAGFPTGEFRPNDQIPRAQVLVGLTNGLKYSAPDAPDATLTAAFSDADSIPAYARTSIAAATTRQMVVNYPDVQRLNPNRTATRAEVAAFIYQALNSTGQVATIASPYLVGKVPTVSRQVKIPSGTQFPVRYDKATRILLGKNEPKPTPITLTVAQNIVSSNGKVLIPAGSLIAGNLVVSQGSAQFLATELQLADGQRLNLDAISEKITKTEVIQKGASTGIVLKDAALGAAAAAGISAVTGDRKIKTWEVLTGAGAGALAGLVFGKDKVELISIQPNTDLQLQLNSELVLPQ
jgi:S-layer homology domain